ncbi:hypothetical protein CPC08DRAFT_606786, partial [Agrocybe pediades]
INNVRDARRFLESKLLLVPDGTTPTSNIMSAALFHIAAMQGLSGLARRAIRSAAYIMEEMEEEATKRKDSDAGMGHENHANEELKADIAEHLKGTISNEISNHIKAIQEATKTALDQIQTTIQEHTASQSQFTQGQGTYSDAVRRSPQQHNTNPTPDPRILAREGIKARQFLLDLPPTSKAHSISTTEIKELLQKAIRKLCGDQEQHILRTVERLPNKGLLIEYLTDNGAKWMKTVNNATELIRELGNIGTDGKWKNRTYNIIAHYVPIIFDPDNQDHIAEALDLNNIDRKHFVKARYAKPIERRSPYQRFAHLIISLQNSDTANKLINQGMTICGKQVDIRKCKKEPLRCLKCHGYNHIARDCISNHDTCGTCGSKTHRTKDCDNPESHQCIPCGGAGHPSWSRTCPTFLKKCDDYDRNHPENAIPFFPSTDAWTWSPEIPQPLTRYPP